MSDTHIIRFSTLVSASGYRFATPAEALALNSPSSWPSILDNTEPPTDLLVPIDETRWPVLLETVDGTSCRYGDGAETCNPACDLANLYSQYATRSAGEHGRKHKAVVEFLGRYGLPFGGPSYATFDEISLVARRFDSALSSANDHSWSHRARYVERFDQAGNRVTCAENFISFCLLTVAHHLNSKRQFMQCEWCNSWSIASRKNKQDGTLLKRFCDSRCRSMSKRKSPSKDEETS
jgi:hypothetical protein